MTQALPNLSVKPGYRPQAADTTPEVDAFGFWLLRQRTTEQRLVMGAALMKDARRLSL